MPDKAKLNTGIIGFGFRAKGILQNILQNDDYVLAALADLHEINLENAGSDSCLKDVRTYKDYKKLLESDEIDCVFITTPQFTHREIAVEAFKAGKHVYCEKPMALTVPDCEEIISYSKKTGKTLMVGQQMRYHAHLNRFKFLIEEGEIGKPVMLWLNEFRNTFPETMKWVFKEKNSGGALMDKCCHHFDVFNWFADSRPVQVYCSGGQDVVHAPFGSKTDLIDNAWVVVDFESGARAKLGLCMFAGLPYKYECGVGTHMREIGVVGERGMIRTEGFDLGRNLEVRYAHNRDSVIHNVKTEGNIPDAYNGEGNRGILIRFAQCIRQGSIPEASGEIGKTAVAVSLAAEKSAAEKRIVKISELLN